MFLRIMKYFKLIKGRNSLYKFIYPIYIENLKYYTGCTASSCIADGGTISRTLRPYLLKCFLLFLWGLLTWLVWFGYTVLCEYRQVHQKKHLLLILTWDGQGQVCKTLNDSLPNSWSWSMTNVMIAIITSNH